MFDDVSHPGAAFYSMEEAAADAFGAAVFYHGGEHCFESFFEAVYFIGWELLEFFEVETHLDESFSLHAPDVGSAERLYFQYFHKKRLEYVVFYLFSYDFDKSMKYFL